MLQIFAKYVAENDGYSYCGFGPTDVGGADPGTDGTDPMDIMWRFFQWSVGNRVIPDTTISIVIIGFTVVQRVKLSTRLH